MNNARYRELMNGAALTAKEVSLGWHFCPDWDGLLVGPNTHEKEGCNCPELTDWEESLRAAGCRSSLPLSLSKTIPMVLGKLEKLRGDVQKLERLVTRCLPYVKADVQMMADLSRFAPLSPDDQMKHDTTEYPSEVLLRDLEAAGFT